MCLCFENGKPILKGFTDADMSSDIHSRKSTQWYLITYSRGVVSVCHSNPNYINVLLCLLKNLSILSQLKQA